jgi:hypothetical protein
MYTYVFIYTYVYVKVMHVNVHVHSQVFAGAWRRAAAMAVTCLGCSCTGVSLACPSSLLPRSCWPTRSSSRQAPRSATSFWSWPLCARLQSSGSSGASSCPKTRGEVEPQVLPLLRHPDRRGGQGPDGVCGQGLWVLLAGHRPLPSLTDVTHLLIIHSFVVYPRKSNTRFLYPRKFRTVCLTSVHVVLVKGNKVLNDPTVRV